MNDETKVCGRVHGLIAARYLPGWAEENHQNLQDILCPSQDSNLASFEYVLHFFGYICNFQFLSDTRIIFWCYMLLLHSRISIVRDQIVRCSRFVRVDALQSRSFLWCIQNSVAVHNSVCTCFWGIIVLLYGRCLWILVFCCAIQACPLTRPNIVSMNKHNISIVVICVLRVGGNRLRDNLHPVHLTQ